MPGASFLDWQAGKNSIYRDNFLAKDWSQGAETVNNIGAIRVRNNGGGKFYGLTGEWTLMQPFTEHEDYRMLVVHGTSQELSFYGLNIERSQSEVQSEIRNASNVRIFYLKGEAFIKDANGKYVKSSGTGPEVIRIKNSDNVMLFGLSGNAQPLRQIDVQNSDNITISNITGVIKSSNFTTLRDTFEGTTTEINGSKSVGILKRGTSGF